jgi:DNA ligase D-like protein (predicted 3'-phosphoesterase)
MSPRFVVHKHAATHLHYDFRLELDGVLKSWAVPKGIPLKPGIKRLAVQVSDHDLNYIDFKGEIPEGMYGAGKVEIWDNGKFELLERSAKKIKFKLSGKKLKGVYELILFKEEDGKKMWLLFKKDAE